MSSTRLTASTTQRRLPTIILTKRLMTTLTEHQHSTKDSYLKETHNSVISHKEQAEQESIRMKMVIGTLRQISSTQGRDLTQQVSKYKRQDT